MCHQLAFDSICMSLCVYCGVNSLCLFQSYSCSLLVLIFVYILHYVDCFRHIFTHRHFASLLLSRIAIVHGQVIDWPCDFVSFVYCLIFSLFRLRYLHY